VTGTPAICQISLQGTILSHYAVRTKWILDKVRESNRFDETLFQGKGKREKGKKPQREKGVDGYQYLNI
jgi:hypothetical protein